MCLNGPRMALVPDGARPQFKKERMNSEGRVLIGSVSRESASHSMIDLDRLVLISDRDFDFF